MGYSQCFWKGTLQVCLNISSDIYFLRVDSETSSNTTGLLRALSCSL